MPSPVSAKEVLETLQSARLDPSILWQHDPRWARLRSGLGRSVKLRDRFRGALIGAAMGDAERQRARETGKRWAGGIEWRRGGDTRPSGFRLGFFRGVMLPSCDG